MSDPREFDRNPNLPRDGYVDRSAGAPGGSSGWIIAGVVAVVLLGLAAYSYRDTQDDLRRPTSPVTTPVRNMHSRTQHPARGSGRSGGSGPAV